MNSVLLVGRIGKVFEWDQHNRPLRFSLATTESFIKDGKRESRTDWHNVIVWGSEAYREFLSNSLKVGGYVSVVGKNRTNSWETAEGEKRSAVVVEAATIELLYGKDETEAKAASTRPAPARASKAVPEAKPQSKESGAEWFDDSDDLPF